MTNQIIPCEIGCELCENLIMHLKEEGKDLEYAKRNRQEIAETYIIRFGKPAVLGEEVDMETAIIEIRSAIVDLGRVEV